MCGITFIKNKNQDIVQTYKGMVNTIQSRGPDNTISKEFDSGGYFYNMTFHRLCVNDLSSAGDQPFDNDDCLVMCNGEIYNYKEIACKEKSIKVMMIQREGKKPQKTAEFLLGSQIKKGLFLNNV